MQDEHLLDVEDGSTPKARNVMTPTTTPRQVGELGIHGETDGYSRAQFSHMEKAAFDLLSFALYSCTDCLRYLMFYGNRRPRSLQICLVNEEDFAYRPYILSFLATFQDGFWEDGA